MSIATPFRAGVAAARAPLEGRERVLFDFVCLAGQLGYNLPGDANIALVGGESGSAAAFAAQSRGDAPLTQWFRHGWHVA